MNVNCFQDSNRRNSKGGGRRVTKKGSSDGRGKRFKTPESEAKHRRKVKRDQKRRDNRRLKEFIFKLPPVLPVNYQYYIYLTYNAHIEGGSFPLKFGCINCSDFEVRFFLYSSGPHWHLGNWLVFS